METYVQLLPKYGVGFCALAVAVFLLKTRNSVHSPLDLGQVSIPSTSAELRISGTFLCLSLALSASQTYGPCTTDSISQCYDFFFCGEAALYLLILYIGGLFNGPQLFAIVVSVMLGIFYLVSLVTSKEGWRVKACILHALEIQVVIWLISTQGNSQDSGYFWPGDRVINLKYWELQTYPGVFFPWELLIYVSVSVPILLAFSKTTWG